MTRKKASVSISKIPLVVRGSSRSPHPILILQCLLLCPKSQFNPILRHISQRKDSRGERTNVGDSGSDTDFDTRVTLLSQLALEELVQLGVEDTVGDELPALRNSSLDSGHFAFLVVGIGVVDGGEGEVEVESSLCTGLN